MFALPPDRVLWSVIAVFWTALSFIIYTLSQGVIRKLLDQRKNVRRTSDINILSVIFQRISGIILFGCIPILLVLLVFKDHPAYYGFELNFNLKFKRR